MNLPPSYSRTFILICWVYVELFIHQRDPTSFIERRRKPDEEADRGQLSPAPVEGGHAGYTLPQLSFQSSRPPFPAPSTGRRPDCAGGLPCAQPSTCRSPEPDRPGTLLERHTDRGRCRWQRRLRLNRGTACSSALTSNRPSAFTYGGVTYAIRTVSLNSTTRSLQIVFDKDVEEWMQGVRLDVKDNPTSRYKTFRFAGNIFR